MTNFANVARFGDPLSNGWQAKNLQTIALPSGEKWTVYKPAATAFQGLLDDLVASGYVPKSSGGFNYRPIRGGSRLMSQHAFGNAIDINAATNALGSRSTDMPKNIAALAEKHGLEWGGTWKKRPDPMHFEWRGGGAQPAPLASPAQAGTTLGGQFSPTPVAQQAPALGAPQADTSLLSPNLTASKPAPLTLPQMFGIPAPVQTEPFNLASMFVANRAAQAERDRVEAERRSAEKTRRAALFGGDLFGPFR